MQISFNTVNYKGISSLNSIKKPIAKNIPNHQRGALSEFDMGIVNEIRDLFELAHSAIKSVGKSCNTRSAIKNGYEKLKTGVAGSRILEFSKIGAQEEDISVNLRVYRGKPKKKEKTIIIIGDTQLIINSNGQIEKNPSMKFIRDNSNREKGEVVSYYSQKEIDNLNPTYYFNVLKSELKKYIDYIKSRCSEIDKIREIKAKNIAGSIEKYKDLIEDVTNEFHYFKTHINKLSESASEKESFRILNKVKTFHAQNSIMLKKAMPDDRSLYLVYSKINSKPAMKLFVMDYNNKDIDKSFVIYDNKLAKYFPKKASDKPNHLEYDFHYFTQEDIDKSGLEYYFNLFKDRLSEVNDKLEQGIADRLHK